MKPTRAHDPTPMTATRAHDPAAIRLRRITVGLDLPRASQATGVSIGHLSNIERGKRGASPQMLQLLAKTYDCAISDFLPAPAVPAERT